MSKCTNCGIELNENMKFCPNCGSSIPVKKVCTNCGTELIEGMKFCHNCGASVENTGNKVESANHLSGQQSPINNNILSNEQTPSVNTATPAGNTTAPVTNTATPAGNTTAHVVNSTAVPSNICTNCGKEIPSEKNFCPYCGTRKNITAVVGNGVTNLVNNASNVNVNEKLNGYVNEFKNFQNSEGVTSNFTPQDIEQNKVMAVLAYLVFFIPLIKGVKSPFVRFHQNQFWVLFIVGLIGGLLMIVPIIGWIAGSIIEVLTFVLGIMGVVSAASGKAKPLPIVGGIKILK